MRGRRKRSWKGREEKKRGRRGKEGTRKR